MVGFKGLIAFRKEVSEDTVTFFCTSASHVLCALEQQWVLNNSFAKDNSVVPLRHAAALFAVVKVTRKTRRDLTSAF